MKTRAMIVAAAFVTAVSCGLSATSRAGEPIHEEVAAKADGIVSIENLAGSVVITGWDENKVLVEGTLGDGADKVKVEKDGDEVTVEVVLPRRARNVDDTDLVIRVPRKSSLDIETVSARVEVEGVDGMLDVETVSGAVDLGGVDIAEVESVSGRIAVEKSTRSVEAESVSGEIVMRQLAGRLSASTTSGAIDVDESKLEVVECETVSGSIEFTGDPRREGTYRFESFSGAVILNLPKDLGAEVEVETFSGSISTDFGGDVRKERYGPGAKLHEQYGDGGAEITVSTFSGSVDLERR